MVRCVAVQVHEPAHRTTVTVGKLRAQSPNQGANATTVGTTFEVTIVKTVGTIIV